MHILSLSPPPSPCIPLVFATNAQVAMRTNKFPGLNSVKMYPALVALEAQEKKKISDLTRVEVRAGWYILTGNLVFIKTTQLKRQQACQIKCKGEVTLCATD